VPSESKGEEQSKGEEFAAGADGYAGVDEREQETRSEDGHGKMEDFFEAALECPAEEHLLHRDGDERREHQEDDGRADAEPEHVQARDARHQPRERLHLLLVVWLHTKVYEPKLQNSCRLSCGGVQIRDSGVKKALGHLAGHAALAVPGGHRSVGRRPRCARPPERDIRRT